MVRDSKVMDRFMEQNLENEGFFLFIDSVADRYDGPSKKPAEQGSSADSPFIGKGSRECHTLLMELQSNSHLDIDTRFFAILEERSSEDESVLLVDNSNEDFGTVRVAFELAMELLMCYVSGHRSVQEDNEAAQREDDNVLRHL